MMKVFVLTCLCFALNLHAAPPAPDDVVLILAESGNADYMNRLAATDADLKTTGAFGETALHLAAMKGRLSIARMLVEKGADLKAKDALGRTPAMLALIHGHPKTGTYLMKAGSPTKVVDATGATVLMWAVRSGDKDLVRKLIREGAKLETTDKKGRTAFDMVRYDNDHIPMADFMRQLSAARGSLKRSDGNAAAVKRKEYAALLAPKEKEAGYRYGKMVNFKNTQAAGYFMLGNLLLAEGSTGKAAASLAEADKLEPGGCLPCQMPLAQLYVATGNSDRALEMIQTIAARQGESTRLMGMVYNMGEQMVANGEAFKAAELFQKIIAKSPESFPGAYYYLGAASDDAGQMDQARNFLSKYLNMDADGKHGKDAKARMNQLSPTHVNVRSLGGKRLNTADYQGKMVLYDIWKNDTPDYQQKILPNLKKAASDFSGQLVIVGINVDGDVRAAASAVASEGIRWDQYSDPGMRYFGRELSVNQAPMLILVDGNGNELLRLDADEAGKKNMVRRIKKALK